MINTPIHYYTALIVGGLLIAGCQPNEKPFNTEKYLNFAVEQVTSALDAGVDGLWCSREWDELKPENAMAFGRAVRDYQRKNK